MSDQNKKNDSSNMLYMPIGMCLGLSIGLAVGSARAKGSVPIPKGRGFCCP